ncbi:MAG: TlpA family protein disulfide reductase [Bryobacteraceae bacterium]
MKFIIVSLIVLAGVFSAPTFAAQPDFYAGFRDVPASVTVFHYKVPAATLRAEFMAGMDKAMQQAKTEHKTVTEPFFVLPQMYVFDKDGHEIFARAGETKDLISRLDHAFTALPRIHGGDTLKQRFANLVPDGKPSAIAPVLTGKSTLLEYWAPWCEYCFVERDQLLTYFRKHRQLAVNWITVDADMAKATGLPVSTNSSRE